MTTPEWFDDAECKGADPNLFHPRGAQSRRWPGADTRGVRRRIARARAICAECPVSEDCLAHAIANGELDGIWGGRLPEERNYGFAIRRCAECGSPFKPRSPQGSICSERCRMARRRQTARLQRMS